VKRLRLALLGGAGLLVAVAATAPAAPTLPVSGTVVPSPSAAPQLGAIAGVRATAALAPARRRAAGQPVTIRYHFDAGAVDPIWDKAQTLRLRPVGLHGGEVRPEPHAAGWAVSYPPPCFDAVTDCPRVVLESDPAPWLNPDHDNVSWGAQVLLSPDNTSDGENVVQKGFSTQGTQYKLQVDHYAGLPSCVVAGLVFGVNRIFVAQWRTSVADGAWHRLDCIRRGPGLALFVDGELRASTVIPVELSIVNPDPLRLGGKGIGPWNDQFHGLMDDVYVTVG
jgi:hypothetical protein